MLQAKVGAFTFAADLNLFVQWCVKAPNQFIVAMPLLVSLFTLPTSAAWLGVAGVCETACALVRRP